MPKATDVYIFGYQSILSKGSLAATLGQHALNSHLVPAWLAGYQRSWNAVRDFQTHASKRYVAAHDWSVAARVAFCNLQAVPGTALNGICQFVHAEQLDELDFREQGYQRIDVTDQIQAYPGHALMPGLACHTYIDLHPSLDPAPTSLRYFEMGLHGARALDAVAPGFFQAYRNSTAEPHLLLSDPVFVFFSPDGRHLWLLDEQDSSLTLLMRFAQSQLTSTTASSSEQVAELSRPVTGELAWLDLRSRRDQAVAHPWIPAAMAVELLQTPDDQLHELAHSGYWLCRLASSQSSKLTPAALATLSNDPDFWVRRAVRQRLQPGEEV
ncbi:MAG: gamma-glutamylcyclotransferase family protein [Pseudomonadota bacterium]